MNHTASSDQFNTLFQNTWNQHNGDSVPSLSSEKIKEIYLIAYELYQDKQYEKASSFFQLLVSASPQEKKFWKGLAGSLQMEKKYQEAISCYIIAQYLSKNNPDPYFYIHTADCHFALGEISEGLIALEGAATFAKTQKNSRVLKHVDLMKKLWSSKKINKKGS